MGEEKVLAERGKGEMRTEKNGRREEHLDGVTKPSRAGVLRSIYRCVWTV